MLRKVLLTVALVGASAAASSATPSIDSSGATLSVAKGTVLVSTGSQFVTARPGQVLKPGDRVMVMQGGSATLDYVGGRSTALPPGSMADIGLPGALTAGRPRRIGLMYAQATDNGNCHNTDGTPAKCANADSMGTTAPASSGSTGTIVLTSLVAVGSIVLLVDAVHSSNNKTPVSP